MEEGRLLPARGAARVGRNRPTRTRASASIVAPGLVTPFDLLLWERSRIERLFGMKYTIEIYLPAPQTGLWLLCVPRSCSPTRSSPAATSRPSVIARF